jgi:sterol desaturase/sphingolipid hydroxylase (fatty acid hydroxylase superfamily)
MTNLGKEIDAPHEERKFGTGWISGILALVLAVIALGAVLCLRYPDLLTMPDARPSYNVAIIRLALHLVLISSFTLGIISIVLRSNKVIGFTAMGMVFVAMALGGSSAQERMNIDTDVWFGLDWFVLNIIILGIVFIPIERIFGKREQPIFRYEWREDAIYFLISTLMVQLVTYLALAPATAILKNTEWEKLRQTIGSQPVLLQFIEIMFLTDLVQYWVHRLFHRIPFLWNFHAIHHSAQAMDWLAASRMHVAEVIILRGTTVIPMYTMGFSEPALYAYLICVFFTSAFVHSNLRVTYAWFEKLLVTPRFHHWHHGIEREAIDVNFAVHFPVLDWLFGTYHMPADGRWPEGYGVHQALPKNYFAQLLYPFFPQRMTPAAPPTDESPKH